MKKGSLVLLTVYLSLYLSTGVVSAQTVTPAPVLAARVAAGNTTPTPTSEATQPTSKPTPATTQAPTPTTQVTVTPTQASQVTDPSVSPEPTQQPQATATPTPLPPTPTPKPQPLFLPITNNPPAQPISKIITAPFDLVMNSLPHSYYSDEGLATATTRTLLAVGLLLLLSGTVMLTWPILVRAKKRLLLFAPKERKALPYLAGRV